ncbi:MAG: Site-specific recombinase invertase Pin [Actinomycetia bacterium]|nr:Site-specific recombinase invertase Pin [Actinomycetes bacterium]
MGDDHFPEPPSSSLNGPDRKALTWPFYPIPDAVGVTGWAYKRGVTGSNPVSPTQVRGPFRASAPSPRRSIAREDRQRRSGGQIRKDLIIPAGKRKGENPSLASIYWALAEHEKTQAHPEAVEQARTEFADLSAAR